jgi:hypothetical protein
VIDATAQQTEVTGELTEEQIKTIDKLIFARESMISQLSGAVGQVAGQIPSQQVGKKRGLFSKILGVAAPFLSFIPGVGPILSTIAGMASSVIGGDYAGAVSAGAAGFSSGGIFRRAPGGRSSTGTPLPPNLSLLSTMPTVNPFPRQFGGPVYEGQRYIVGERGPETFTAARNGYITPQGGGDGSLVAVAAELRAAIQHLNSMPANQVVMRGARGIVRAMDHDAGLIRLVSQRQRLA